MIALLVFTITGTCFFVLGLYSAKHEEPKPVPTAATRLMVETFQEVAEKQNTGLARCMSLVHICERFRLTHDEQMKTIFKMTRDDLCKGKK